MQSKLKISFTQNFDFILIRLSSTCHYKTVEMSESAVTILMLWPPTLTLQNLLLTYRKFLMAFLPCDPSKFMTFRRAGVCLNSMFVHHSCQYVVFEGTTVLAKHNIIIMLGQLKCNPCKFPWNGFLMIIKTWPFNLWYQRTNSPILSPYFSYKSTVEKLLKYQENPPWVIISLILMTSGVE